MTTKLTIGSFCTAQHRPIPKQSYYLIQILIIFIIIIIIIVIIIVTKLYLHRDTYSVTVDKAQDLVLGPGLYPFQLAGLWSASHQEASYRSVWIF